MKETNTHNDNLTLETMTTYRIQANAIDSTYEAESEEEALQAYAKDAGYSSYEEVVEQFGEVDSIEEVESEIITVKNIKRINESNAEIELSNGKTFKANKNENGWCAYGNVKRGNYWETDDYETLEEVGEDLTMFYNEG